MALAKAQFGNAALSSECISGRTRSASNACIFYTVTQGNIAEPCYATSGDCYTTPKATLGIGVLRGKDFPNQDAYPAANGYRPCHRLGSVNVANLLAAY